MCDAKTRKAFERAICNICVFLPGTKWRPGKEPLMLRTRRTPRCLNWKLFFSTLMMKVSEFIYTPFLLSFPHLTLLSCHQVQMPCKDVHNTLSLFFHFKSTSIIPMYTCILSNERAQHSTYNILYISSVFASRLEGWGFESCP